MEDAGANDDIEASVDEDPDTMADPKRYRMTDKVDWTRREHGEGRIIEPVPVCVTDGPPRDIQATCLYVRGQDG